MSSLMLLATAAYGSQRFIHYPVVPGADVKPPSDCERYLHDWCKNWKVAEWLPALMTGRAVSKPSHVNFRDAFTASPAEGTPFTYGKAGPPQGTVVYDYTNAIAFYSHGCCSWRSTVLAAEAGPPPIRVANRMLRNVRTLHGAALGDQFKRVEEIYGKATSQPVPGQTGMTFVSYEHPTSSICAQYQSFGFEHQRLIYIELLDAC